MNDLDYLLANHAVGLCPEERCVTARDNLAALAAAASAANVLLRDGYLLVSEAELATALGKVIPQTAIAQSSDWNKGTDGPFPEPTRWFVADDQRLAAAIFAALVAAQEKGDLTTSTRG
jgi:hypothetical protein